MKKLNLLGVSLLLAWLFCGCGSPESRVELIQLEDQIDIVVNDKILTSYIYGKHLSKPVLYPVYSPSGEVLTRGFPFMEVEGESQDHSHHTGVYFTYGSHGEVNGNSYWWNMHDLPPMSDNPKLPAVRQIEIVEMSEGNGYARLASVNHWVDSIGEVILKEDRLMEFFVSGNDYRIDFTIELSATDKAVTFDDTKEGIFAMRVADWLAEKPDGTLYKGTGEFLNAEGEKTEKGVWGKRSSWVRLEGEKSGNSVGVAIFHHPGSLNYPAYWHARAYGCFAANPIGQYNYQLETGMDNPQYRTWTVKPGEKGLFKFRLLVYDGSRTKEQLEQEFKEFSKR